jgi:hypothetical protein
MDERTLHEAEQAAERRLYEKRDPAIRTLLEVLAKNTTRASTVWHLIRVLELIGLAQRTDALNTGDKMAGSKYISEAIDHLRQAAELLTGDEQ